MIRNRASVYNVFHSAHLGGHENRQQLVRAPPHLSEPKYIRFRPDLRVFLEPEIAKSARVGLGRRLQTRAQIRCNQDQATKTFDLEAKISIPLLSLYYLLPNREIRVAPMLSKSPVL